MTSDKFTAVCPRCGANLVFAGSKRFKTQRVSVHRLPFLIKISEKYGDRLIELINNTKNGYLFPSPDPRAVCN